MGRGDPERVAQCGGGMGEGGTLVFSFQGRRRETPSGRFKGFSGVRGTLHRSLARMSFDDRGAASPVGGYLR